MFYELTPGDHLAVIAEDGKEYSYSDLISLMREIEWKSEPGRDLIFCLCENSMASLVGYLGCLNGGAVPLLLDKKIDVELLSNLLNNYLPNYIWAPASMGEILTGYRPVCDLMHYSLFKREQYAPKELFEDLGLLLTTSGSTGSPKLVRMSYVNMQSNAEAIAEYLELDESERAITTLPMNYTYGLSIINSHLQVGAAIILTDVPMNMKRFWDIFKETEATSFGGVPFTYEMLKRMGFFKMDLPSLRYMTQAGGKLGPELHREYAEWCMERGKSFIVMYGQTEASPRMGYLPAQYSLSKYGSMGIPIPRGEFILTDVDGNPISEPGTVGELVYKGDNVTLGYAERPEDLSKGDERGGVLETGDMAKFDEDGFYYIVGRKKRFLKVFGNRVNLDEIDRLIKAEYDGIDCASTGKDDHLVIFITDASVIDSVRQWISATTHLSESAISVRYIDQIPKNEAGKTLYKDLPNT